MKHTSPVDHSAETPPDEPQPGSLSQSDPPPHEAERGRPPALFIVIGVLLVLVFMALHLTGVLGPGTH
jgi:hypothetical protein